MAELPPNDPNLNPHLRAELKRGQASDRFEAGPQSVKAAKVETLAYTQYPTTAKELEHARRTGTPEPFHKYTVDAGTGNPQERRYHGHGTRPILDNFWAEAPGGDERRSLNSAWLGPALLHHEPLNPRSYFFTGPGPFN